MITVKLQRLGGQRVACVVGRPVRLGSAFGARAKRSAEAGYALTDALVAMLILSLTLVMSMRALDRARAAAGAAWEARRADSLIGHLIEAAPHRYASSGGVSDGFAWRVETTITGAERPVAICRRAVSLQSQASGRHFEAATLETCPVEPAA